MGEADARCQYVDPLTRSGLYCAPRGALGTQMKSPDGQGDKAGARLNREASAKSERAGGNAPRCNYSPNIPASGPNPTRDHDANQRHRLNP